MKTRRNHWMLIAAGVIAAIGLAVLHRQAGEKLPAADAHIDKLVHAEGMRKKSRSSAPMPDKSAAMARGGLPPAANAADETPAAAESPENLSEEDRREQEEERLVDVFDALTDKWMEPAKSGVTMKDVDAFAAQFRQVPKDRKEECLHRALNLIPDENVMLLAGILMDKSQDKELIELIYNDVLNRDEDVKKPILQQIFKDREHPCWADTAWILDVTGELPSKE